MNEAFPETIPLSYIYDVRTYELEIPQPYQLMAEYTAINSTIDYNGMQPFFTNQTDTGRFGPYWNQIPANLRSPNCDGFKLFEDVIRTHYFTS